MIEEMADLQSMQGTKTGDDLFNEVSGCCDKLGRKLEWPVGMATMVIEI